jgi:hypothetical protein
MEPDVLELFESLVWRLVAAGSTIERASLHIGTLHPELFAFSGIGIVPTDCDDEKGRRRLPSIGLLSQQSVPDTFRRGAGMKFWFPRQ